MGEKTVGLQPIRDHLAGDKSAHRIGENRQVVRRNIVVLEVCCDFLRAIDERLMGVVAPEDDLIALFLKLESKPVHGDKQGLPRLVVFHQIKAMQHQRHALGRRHGSHLGGHIRTQSDATIDICCGD